MLKRVTTLIGAAALALGLAAGSAGTAQADKLQDILDRGVVRIGVPVDVPPFGSTDAKGDPIGFDIDMAKMVAEGLGVDLEMQQITGINRIPFLLSNKVDIVISVFGATPARARQVTFTSPYASLFLGIYGPAKFDVSSADELGDLTVSVPRGTTQDITLSRIAPDAKILRFEDDATANQAMLTGQADLLGTANIVAKELIARDPEKNIELKFVLRLSPAHIGIAHGNPDLLRWLDTFIFFNTLNGNLNELHLKWFGEPMQKLPTL